MTTQAKYLTERYRTVLNRKLKSLSPSLTPEEKKQELLKVLAELANADREVVKKDTYQKLTKVQQKKLENVAQYFDERDKRVSDEIREMLADAKNPRYTFML